MATMTMVSLSDPLTPYRPPEMIASAIVRPRPDERPNCASFAVLPEEIIVNILEWCDFKGVLACQLTCRALRDVIANSTSLLYKLALAEHGMCDGPSSTLSTAEKFDLLTAHAAAWQNLDSARPEKADLLVGWSAPRAVSGNIIIFSKDVFRQAQARLHGHERERAHGDNAEQVGTWRPMEPSLDLLVLRVPSALRRIEAAHWVLPLPENTSGVCIDASQDLLIHLSGHRAFHVRTLSTGAVYPLVEHEGFFNTWGGSRLFDVSNLCACGDFVAAGTRVYFISVWNWKTGQLVCDKRSDVTFSSFDFLDEHHLLYSNSMQDSIYVYALRQHNADDQQQQKEQETEVDTKTVRFQLALPPIDRTRSSRYIQHRRNALPTRTESLHYGDARAGDSSSGGGGAPPFHADPRERLIVVRIVTSPVERGEEQFELHIPARALLDHCAAATAAPRPQREGCKDCDDHTSGDEGKDVEEMLPWSAWRDAVRATPERIVPYTIQARMVAYGMRVVSHPPDWEEGVLHVDSYLPRARRREGVHGDADADVVEENARGGRGKDGMRQAIRLPGDAESKAGLVSVLCEDALLCYKLDPLTSRISHAYWYTF